MLWHQFGTDQWFAAVVVASFITTRIVKAVWKSAPSLALPTVALVSAYAIVFVDLALDPTDGYASDAYAALWAVLLGGGAVAGHETLKKLLVAGLKLIPSVTDARAMQIAETILGKLKERAKPPSTKRTTTAALLVLFFGLPLLGCGASPMAIATKASNAIAISQKHIHTELIEQRKTDQMEAAAAVPGDRDDPEVKQKKLAAAQKVGVRYRKAWKAYDGARFSWLRVVAALKIAKENPALFDPGSLTGLVKAMMDAHAELEAFARETMNGVKALRSDAPPPAPEVSP